MACIRFKKVNKGGSWEIREIKQKEERYLL